jgi:hypothetical protein
VPAGPSYSRRKSVTLNRMGRSDYEAEAFKNLVIDNYRMGARMHTLMKESFDRSRMVRAQTKLIAELKEKNKGLTTQLDAAKKEIQCLKKRKGNRSSS